MGVVFGLPVTMMTLPATRGVSGPGATWTTSGTPKWPPIAWMRFFADSDMIKDPQTGHSRFFLLTLLEGKSGR